MKFEAQLGGKQYTVEYETTENGRRNVRLNDESPVLVDVRRVEPDVWSLIIIIGAGVAPSTGKAGGASPSRALCALGGQSYEVTIQSLNGKLRVTIGGASWDIDIYDPSHKQAASGTAVATEGQQVITSPMPGRVVTIKVKVGETVSAGQGVIVVEAMKMENELTAEGAGTVKEVKVREGDAVEDGQALIAIG